MDEVQDRIGVVRGGRGGRPVREEELLDAKFEAGIGWENSRNSGEVVR